MGTSLQDLNDLRQGKFKKEMTKENFLKELNEHLLPFEKDCYQDDIELEEPLFFVFGLPRSGTTLSSQILTHAFDFGYINNFVARYWLSPITGLKQSDILFSESKISFDSDYANTENMTDLHEFGYFWRYWLKKNNIEDFVNFNGTNIDFEGLKKVLANIQHHFNKPVLMKNIFGAIHAKELTEKLKKINWIYIERDPAEVATSMLDARMKFYGNYDTWWSTIPPNYYSIKNLPYMKQIAEQVKGLRSFYNQIQSQLSDDRIIRIAHSDLIENPNKLVKKVSDKFSLEVKNQVSLLKKNTKYFDRPEYIQFKDLIKIDK